MTVAAPPQGRAAVRRLSLARVTSAAGSQAARTALVFHIYDRTKSASWVTAVLLADMATMAALGPLAGWLGDRADRRRVMIGSELAAAIVYLGLVPVHAPVLLVVGATIATAVNSPFLPTSSAAIPNLVDSDDLRWANSRMSLSSNGALIIGPMIGGWLLALTNLGAVFAVNAVSFALSAVVIREVNGRFAAGAYHEGSGMRDGYRVIAKSRVILMVTLALALTHLTFGLALVADPVLADDYHAGAIGYAMFYSTWGVVALFGAWLAGRNVPEQRVPYGVLAGLAAIAGACAAISLLHSFWWMVAVGSLGGVGSGIVFPLTTGIIQQHSPDHVRARVFGAIDTFDRSMYAVGMLVAAPLVGSLGAQPTYAVIAALIAVTTVGLAGLPAAVRASASPGRDRTATVGR